MEDLGMKMKDMRPIEATNGNENKIRYPSLFLDKAPMDLMDKEIGHVCRIEAIVKIVGKHISDGPEGKRKTIDLEFHKLGYKTPSGKMDKDEYLKMNDEDRAKYDKEDVESKQDKEKDIEE